MSISSVNGSSKPCLILVWSLFSTALVASGHAFSWVCSLRVHESDVLRMQKELAAKVEIQNIHTLKQVVRASSPIQGDTAAVKPRSESRERVKRIKNWGMWCSRLNVGVTSSSSPLWTVNSFVECDLFEGFNFQIDMQKFPSLKCRGQSRTAFSCWESCSWEFSVWLLEVEIPLGCDFFQTPLLIAVWIKILPGVSGLIA